MNKWILFLLGCLGLFVLTASVGPPSLSEDQSFRLFNPPEQGPPPDSGQIKRLHAVYGTPDPPSLRSQALPPKVDASTLWLARAIYSETKVPHEQELVGWVIRNRVETGYRGKTTYKGVVLDPFQFSAFNPRSSKRQFYTQLTPETNLPTWQQALWIAYYVRHADPVYRPFSLATRHFYSERSMRERRQPRWAHQHQFVSLGWGYRVNEYRFRFYEEIS